MTEHDEIDRSDAAAEQARVAFTLPVHVRGTSGDGRSFNAPAVVENMTRRGAFIRLAMRLDSGSTIGLYSAEDSDRRIAEMEVVWTRDADEGVAGSGLKLVGDNGEWMAYLVEHSVRAAEGESPERD